MVSAITSQQECLGFNPRLGWSLFPWSLLAIDSAPDHGTGLDLEIHALNVGCPLLLRGGLNAENILICCT